MSNADDRKRARKKKESTEFLNVVALKIKQFVCPNLANNC